MSEVYLFASHQGAPTYQTVYSSTFKLFNDARQ